MMETLTETEEEIDEENHIGVRIPEKKGTAFADRAGIYRDAQ